MQRELQIEGIVIALLGTCQTLEDVLTPQELEDAELLIAIDERAKQCVCCGWWDEPDNMTDDECDECHLDDEISD